MEGEDTSPSPDSAVRPTERLELNAHAVLGPQELTMLITRRQHLGAQVSQQQAATTEPIAMREDVLETGVRAGFTAGVGTFADQQISVARMLGDGREPARIPGVDHDLAVDLDPQPEANLRRIVLGRKRQHRGGTHTLRGAGLEGRVQLDPALLQHNPLGDLPQPFRFVVGMSLRPQRTWSAAPFDFTWRRKSGLPPVRLRGSGVAVVSFLNRTGGSCKENRGR